MPTTHVGSSVTSASTQMPRLHRCGLRCMTSQMQLIRCVGVPPEQRPRPATRMAMATRICVPGTIVRNVIAVEITLPASAGSTVIWPV